MAARLSFAEKEKKCEIVNPTVEEKLVRLSAVSRRNYVTRQVLGLV